MTEIQHTLKERARRIRAVLKDSATGPLFAAVEIVQLSENWAAHLDEAGGRTCSDWLRDEVHPERSLGWYKARARAHEAFGGAICKRLDHYAAVWLVNNVPSTSISPVRDEVSRLYRENNSMPVTASQARKLGRAVLGLVETLKEGSDAIEVVKDSCPRCIRLETQLLAAGIHPSN
jgi:hypothetical protein